MPNWGEVLKEIEGTIVQHPVDTVRRKYLSIYSEYTDRNVIAYYSGFLQKANGPLGIDDNDKNAFMQAVNKMDRSKGLDLILHTPGGDIAATESIVAYLKSLFNNDIRVIIPHMAMSAGTMIALSSKEIIMGKQSNLGPIDPQLGGVSCHGVIEEFKKALSDINEDANSVYLWQPILGKYHPTFIGDCEKAIKWSEDMVTRWLRENMLEDDKEKAKSIVDMLSDHDNMKSHARHLEFNEIINIGIKVKALEGLDDRAIEGCKDFQDCVLTLHHAYMHTFSITDNIKIVENHLGSAMITHGH